MKKITILGSCRQDSIKNINGVIVDDIHDHLNYPHYSKEVLQQIKFLLGKSSIELALTSKIFRSCILNKWPLQAPHVNFFKKQFEESDTIVIEIASLLQYQLPLPNDKYYCHHIISEKEYNNDDYDTIKISNCTREELTNDIEEIKHLCNDKRLIFVGHLYTYKKGNRYMLSQWLREICQSKQLIFIDPMDYLKEEEYDILFEKEKLLAHYTTYGHSQIQKVYEKFINE